MSDSLVHDTAALPDGASAADDEALAFPLSFAQERLWFLDRLQPGGTSYLTGRVLRLRGPLDADALRAALDEIVARHESLRTTFAEVDGEAAQVVAPRGGWPLAFTDLSDLPADARTARALSLLRDETERPFDLDRGPLVRGALVRLDAGEHLLSLVLHHIVTDGWSMGVLAGELAALYDAFSRGEPSPLAELPIQYADYAVWQREEMEGAAQDAQLAYWRRALAGAPALIGLPTDLPRPPAQSFRGGTHPVRVSAAVTGRLREVARAEGATLFMAVLAGFQALLARWSGEDDLVVGTPVAGRGREELEGLIGLFANTLALRADLSGDPSFRTLLGRAREAVLDAHAHAEVPFERVVAEVQPERALSHAPLFQVLLALSAPAAGSSAGGASGGAARMGALAVEAGGAGSESAAFDLSLILAESAGELRGVLQYAADLFLPDTVARMADHLVRLLEGAAAGPDTPLSRLPLLGDDERRRVLEAWGAASDDDGDDAAAETVEGWVARRAAEAPDAVAATGAGASLTYAQLDAAASRLAHHLRRRGAGPEARVGVYLDRSPRALVAMVGILRAGAAYVPLDPAYPAARVDYLLRDAAVRLVVTGAGLGARLPAAVETVCLDGDAEVLAAESSEPPPSVAHAGNLAYVIHTSGSTGRPKGVMVTRGALARSTRVRRDVYGERVQGFLLLSSFSFDSSVAGIFWTLRDGGTLVLAELREVSGGAALARLAAAEGVSHLLCVPSLHAELLRAVDAPPPALRTVIVAGERCPASLVDAHAARLPGVRLFNEYGPTENTVWSTAHLCAGGEGEPVPVGRPVPGTRAYVLDAHGGPAPAGAAGELHVGGGQVARGYLGRPSLTAERFVPDPFSAGPGARVYRTGDRVRWRADGVLEFLGRADEQLKVRGYRVEPGEVEAALRAHPRVRDAAVGVHPSAPGVLAAWFAADPADAPEAAELRAWLGERLPEPLVPAAYLRLDVLPVTPNGKTDRRALPAPGAAARHAYVPPRTRAEAEVARVWAELLGTEQVGAEDHFFELGGHSLLGMRVMAGIRAALGVELPLRALFEAPTVAGLAARAEAADAAPPGEGPRIPRAPRGDGLPLSFAQERLWFLHRLGGGDDVYAIPLSLRIRGPLDIRALGGAVDEVVRRHESLRTVFAEAGGTPLQRVLPPPAGVMEMEDLSALPPEARAARTALRTAEATRFDLARGPVFRARLLRLGPDEHLLLAGMHHIVSDGWSTGVLLRELGALYAAFARGEDSPLAEPQVQYADFAAWQRARLRAERVEGELDWWTARLAGAPALLELATDRPRPPVKRFAGAAHAFRIPPRVAEGAAALARATGATPFMVLLAAFQLLLARVSGQDDVVVGTPVSGRGEPETEGMIGLFVNTLALRARLTDDLPFQALLAQVRDTALGAYAHAELPFERLVDALRVERSLSHTPLFQAMFLHQPAGGVAGGARFPGLQVEVQATERGTAKFDLTLALSEDVDGLAGVLEYDTDLFDAATAGRLAAQYGTLLAAAVADPSRRAGVLELLDAAGRRAVLHGFNDTALPYPPDDTLVSLLEAQRARTPDALALVHGTERFTYAQIHARADRLARHLARRGAGPEARVGVCLERTPELLVALLAVLKAGAAYVPLDPAYPPDRLAYMLADCEVRLLVTRAGVGDALAGEGIGVVRLDQDADAVAAEPDGPPPGRVWPGALAYFIYTSGSTGRPKGVMIEHRSVAAFMHWCRAEFAPADVAGMLASTSVCFDISVYELFFPLTVGGAVILASNALALPTLPARDEVTLLNTVPSAGAELVRLGAVPPRARVVNLAGEPLKRSLVDAVYATGTVAEVRNMYGPSEDTTYSTCALVPAGDARAPTLGRPIANSRVYLLDSAGAPVPPGVPGEVFIGGAGLARGYQGRPALTAGRWVPDPFSPLPGARLYRTGDLARWRADGELEFIGRRDHQVKVRGFRIELGEVEAALLRHPALADAAAVVRVSGDGDARLVAYAVPRAGMPAPSAAELRAHLRGWLPEHMVPSALVTLDVLPLNPNGKVDRLALPDPDPSAGAGDGYEAPATAAEEVVAFLMARVLGVERVGVNDDFFALGGHSLLALRLMSRIQAELGRDLPLASLYRGATPRALAGMVEEAGGEESPVVPLVKGGTCTPLFCVHPVGGDVISYRDLARRLAPDLALHGIRAVWPFAAGATVPSLAAGYLRAVRRVQPAGPYRLAGWSMGGAVAWEMACQLRAAGEAVELLALLDARIYAGGPLTHARALRPHLEEHVPDGFFDRMHALPLAEQVAFARQAAQEGGMSPFGVAAIDLYATLHDAWRAYDPPRYDGDVLLVHAADDPQPGPLEGRGSWRARVDGVLEVVPVAATHPALVYEPAAGAVAEALRARLGEDGG